MKLSKIFPILIILAMLIISACKKDKVAPADPPPPTPEELFNVNCGIIPPVIGCINGAKVFVPNAISPNSNGFNDILFPFGGDGLKEVVSFKIYNEAGNLIFENSNFWLNNPNEGWDGKLPDGSTQDGIYSYTISFSNTLNEIAEFEGAVCVRTSLPVNCVENEKHMAWGTQHNGNGGLDFALPSYEDCE